MGPLQMWNHGVGYHSSSSNAVGHHGPDIHRDTGRHGVDHENHENHNARHPAGTGVAPALGRSAGVPQTHRALHQGVATDVTIHHPSFQCPRELRVGLGSGEGPSPSFGAAKAPMIFDFLLRFVAFFIRNRGTHPACKARVLER